ncbi:MAG: hypothetical protein LBJ13_02465 [Puniceicoccales bacterium]|nr:hypothetical protein [Puniceicoccales bacterium]
MRKFNHLQKAICFAGKWRKIVYTEYAKLSNRAGRNPGTEWSEFEEPVGQESCIEQDWNPGPKIKTQPPLLPYVSNLDRNL